MYQDMTKILNEGQVGQFRLTKFTITKENRGFRNPIPYGDYIKLSGSYGCIMSDTPMEKRTNADFVYNANGDVFIAGLGLGMIIMAIQDKEDVKSITVLEKYPEIIELVGKQLPFNDKVQIIEGDVFSFAFPKNTKFDTIYFDIWNYINSDVYEEMKQLKSQFRKYKRTQKENPNSFMKCWCEYEARNNRPLL